MFLNLLQKTKERCDIRRTGQAHALAKRFKHSLDAFELPFKTQGLSMYLAWHPRNNADPAIYWMRDQIIKCVIHRDGFVT